MKKIIYIAIGAMMSFTSFGQVIFTISGAQYQGDTLVVTGGAHVTQTHYMQVHNLGGTITNATIMRKKITSLTGSGDYFCWGVSCYPESIVAPYDPWTSPDPITMPSGDSSLLSLDYEPHGNIGVSQFRYYLLNGGGTKLDSTDVKYITTDDAGIAENNNSVSFSVYPNPAKGDVYIAAAKNVETDYKVLDLLGSVIETGKVSQGAAHINTSALNNGIYFVVVGTGKESVAKKIVVRN